MLVRVAGGRHGQKHGSKKGVSERRLLATRLTPFVLTHALRARGRCQLFGSIAGT